MENIYGYLKKDLENYLVDAGFKKFNATQIFEGLYRKKVKNFEDISNISLNLKQHLKDNFSLELPKISKKQVSHDGTTKYLLELVDGNCIETVLMIHEYGYSLCVSSQVGCNMGCKFCASGLKKKLRSLNAYELVSQIILVENDLNIKISHVVVMGTGEPFDNYDNLMKFIRIINDPKGLEIGARHITVSTCGIVPKIYEYANENIQTNLAISLHAPSDEVRDQIMLINRKYRINDVINACKDYYKVTNRRITFEYILLKDVNNKVEHAKELAKLIKGMNAYVNLIPYNEVDEFSFKSVSKEEALKFYDVLKKQGINVTLRKEHGRDIDAACGQLRLKSEKIID